MLVFLVGYTLYKMTSTRTYLFLHKTFSLYTIQRSNNIYSNLNYTQIYISDARGKFTTLIFSFRSEYRNVIRIEYFIFDVIESQLRFAYNIQEYCTRNPFSFK